MSNQITTGKCYAVPFYNKLLSIQDSDIEDADDSQAEDTQEEDLGSQDEGTEAGMELFVLKFVAVICYKI